MASPDAPAAAGPKQARAAGCAMAALIFGLVLVVAIGFVSTVRFSVGGEMPELRRPMAVLQGTLELDARSPSARIEADLRLDDGAVTAMREGDGLVHLELDLETASDLESILVGVSWPGRAEVLRPVEPLPLDEDVRWTLACADAEACARTIGFEIQLPEGGPATEVSWRLVAGVRPPREAEVPEVAVVELALRGVSE